jgi:hypothetical protein
VNIGQDTGTVVPFSGLRKDMRFPAISEVRAYWEALRKGRTAPLRSEINPRGIERALENAFVLERVAPQVSRFRLAGMCLNDLMGIEVRGMPITALFSSSSRNQAAEAVENVFQRPEIIEMSLKAEAGFGKPPIEAKLLLLPLYSDLGDLNRALGCLVAIGNIGRTPRRFDLSEITVTPIIAGQIGSRQQIMSRGFAESQSPLVRPEQTDRSHLRLVKTDE